MRKLFACISLLLLFVSAHGQDGSPLLTHFRENRDIENQNWAICQDSDKVMLFANRKGILTFDGEDWTPVRLPVTPYAMRSNPYEQRIYIGGENNYGYMQKDRKGIYRYISLSGDSADLGMITRITFNDSLAVFFGDRSVSCYNIKRNAMYKRFISDEGYPFTGTFLKGGNIFVNVAEKGLHRVDADSLFPIVTGYLTKKTDILFSLPYDRERVVLGFNNGKLSLFDGIKYYNYTLNDDDYISANVLSEGITMGDSLYAFSTLGGGAVVVGKNTGKVRFLINNQNGLPDDEIFGLGCDVAGGMWLSHPFGLTRADLRLPVGNYGIFPGLKGNLSASLSYKNELYAATSEGVFWLANEMNYREVEVLRRNKVENTAISGEAVKEITTPLVAAAKPENTRKGILNRIFGRKATIPDENSDVAATTTQTAAGPVTIRNVPVAKFRTEKVKQLKSIDYVYRKIDGINEKCRQLVPTENGILAATNRGLYVIADHKGTLIAPERYINYITWKPESGKYTVATSDGWFIAEFSGGKWKVAIPDRSFSDPVYSVTVGMQDAIWLGGDNKAWKVIESDGTINYESYVIGTGFSQRCLVDYINDTVFLFTETSVNVFDKAAAGFVPYKSAFVSENAEYKYPVSNVPLITSGNRWIYPETHERVRKKDLCLLKLFDDVVSVYSDDGKIWVVDGSNNLFGIDCEKASSMSPETDLLVKNIRNEEGTVFDMSDVVFARGDNVINFDIVVPAYLNKDLTEYQYFIDKVMTEWSQWSTRTSYSRG
ncbi:MAG: hypothetical protein ACM3UT_03430, partial [Chloroflexota bacterium]